jgi:IclR family acetate operon transcriptional repressor
VLRALARAGEPLSAAEVARRTGIPGPTVQRLLATLSDEALAVREPDGGWRVGPGVQDLAGTDEGIPALVARADDVLRELVASVGESVLLTRVRLPDIAEVLVQHDADRLLGVTRWVGRVFEPRESVAWWVVAAALDDDEVAALGGADPDDRARWLEDISLTRARGFALDVDRLERGLTSLAVLVSSGPPGIVLGCAGPSTRLTPERAAALVPALRDASARLLAE